MSVTFMYVLIFVVVVSVVVGVVLTRKRRGPRPPVSTQGRATYSGPIRFTGPDGRDMKIIQKDDGTFDVVEEDKQG